jgi:hypothetical protein
MADIETEFYRNPERSAKREIEERPEGFEETDSVSMEPRVRLWPCTTTCSVRSSQEALLPDFSRLYSHLQLINFGLNSPPLFWLLLK